MLFNQIKRQFAECKSWEERYRLLIQFSRQLPTLKDDELATLPEIDGCESRLWFKFNHSPREIIAYSDARLMQGLLAILKIALTEQSTLELQQFDIQALFDELQITRHLTSTRLNGLKQIQGIVRNSVQPVNSA